MNTTSTPPTTGVRHGLRARWAAIGAAIAVTLGAVGVGGLQVASADKASGDRPIFVPITPCRLLDTRPSSQVGPRSTKLGAETMTLTTFGNNGQCSGASAIPTDAVALSMNVTALQATTLSFLTFWGAGDRPNAANLNPSPGEPPTPNAVVSPISNTGALNVYNDVGAVHLTIDINGYYVPHNHDDRYRSISSPVVVAPADFSPGLPTTPFSRISVLNLTGSGCFDAPLSLPDGATITKVTAKMSVTNASDNAVVILRRHSFAAGQPAATASGIEIANQLLIFPSSNVVTDVSDSTIDPALAVVDNQTYIYTARVCAQTAQAVLYAYVVEFS